MGDSRRRKRPFPITDLICPLPTKRPSTYAKYETKYVKNVLSYRVTLKLLTDGRAYRQAYTKGD